MTPINGLVASACAANFTHRRLSTHPNEPDCDAQSQPYIHHKIRQVQAGSTTQSKQFQFAKEIPIYCSV